MVVGILFNYYSLIAVTCIFNFFTVPYGNQLVSAKGSDDHMQALVESCWPCSAFS